MQDALRLENDELAKEIRQLRTAHSARADSLYGRSFACTLWPSLARVPADWTALPCSRAVGAYRPFPHSNSGTSERYICLKRALRFA